MTKPDFVTICRIRTDEAINNRSRLVAWAHNTWSTKKDKHFLLTEGIKLLRLKSKKINDQKAAEDFCYDFVHSRRSKKIPLYIK